MIRSGSADQPDDARRGRPGWRAGSRKRGTPPEPPPSPAPPARTPYRPQQPPPSAFRPEPRAQPASRPPWQSTPPPRRTTYRPDGYPPPEHPRDERPFPPPDYPRDERRPQPPPAARNETVAAEPLVGGPPPTPPVPPRKLTVTRVAAYRSKQLTQQAVHAFRRAAQADGAHESGLTSLTYAVMLNYASSATMAVGLANTLFFSAATAESRAKVAIYLLITVAPFALIAPVIGPMLDRVQHGRRFALAVSCVGQGLLSVVMALHLNDWLLYPAALGTLVLSKSFDVLKAAVTPRVLPSGITLSKTNARLAVFGLAAGTVFGVFGIGFAKMFGSPGALWFTAVLCIADAWLCLRIPAWVEVTEGEVPASLRATPGRTKRQPIGRHVVVGLWGNGTIRLLTGFLLLFPAFVIKSMEEHSPTKQLLLLGLIGGAAGIGSFAGNAIGARLHFGKPDQVINGCLIGALSGAVLAAITGNVTTAAIAALIAAVGSGLAKISLDATIQNDLPEESRASAFGRSETILQLAWVFGGAMGVLLPATFWIGFTVVSVLMALGLVQTTLSRRGQSLVPALGGFRATLPNVLQRTRGRRANEDDEPPTRQATRAMPTERTDYPYDDEYRDEPYDGQQTDYPYGPPAPSADRTS
ncbi:MAG TPA: MFS transporter [Pseudonocardiaceae bacterium]|nr:MFS transporter [Pseudonocardiaceae bacterium]